MFLERRHSLHFDEFDQLVQRFFGERIKETELRTLALDLQTTGAFGAIGNHIHFAIPAFYDYLIALRFLSGDFKLDEETGRIPTRMPTTDQVIMWAGLAETERKGIDYHLKLLSKNKITVTSELDQWILFDANLTLYAPPGSHFVSFDYVNSDAPGAVGVRTVANSVVLNAAVGSDSTILVKIINRRGMHARAVAKLVSAYDTWLEELASRWEKPVLWMSREGPGEDKTVLSSIMGLLTLGGGPGTTFAITFENCHIAEVETLLERIYSRRPTSFNKYWEITFGEEE
jgi:phosphotransferase system HPr-like phosphotransfer protein